MIKKMYSNYEINKKYAIRKLSIGAFSIAIGLFASNMNELPVIGTHLGPNIVHAAEPEVTNWQPDGNIIAQGEDGVPWELYENGYLLFKPEPGKDTLTNGTFPHYITSWKNYSDKIKAIGFTKEVFLPEDSSFFFKGSENLELPEGYWEEEDYKKNLSNLEFIETSKINTSKTKNMRGLFYRVEKIKQLNLNNWDVSNVNDMSKMFWSSNFNYLDLNDWNTINVKNMYEMFRETRDLETLKVSNWNTSNVTNMTAMFFIYPNKEQGNSKLKELDVSKWDVSNVEDFRYMFEGQDKLEKLNVSNWNPIKAKSMYYMFHSASSLKNLDVSKWDVSNAEQLGGLFVNNYSLQYLDLTNWDITNLPNVDTASYNKFAIIGAIFQNLKSLNKLKIGINFKPTGSENIFEGLRFHLQPEKYTERWVKEDGSEGPYTVNEWWEAYKANPEILAGTWVREKKPVLTVNFNTGSNETIKPLSVNGNSTDELPVPTEDKPGYKFLGWSKTEDGDIIKNKSEIGQPGETVTLYAKWEKVDNIRKENTPIEMTTVYEGDEELEKGTNKEINGVPGEKEIITTYEVTPITGELINPSTTENIITPMTPKTIKVGTKPKVVYTKQGDNVIKTTTRYTVNPNNGDVTENVTEEIVGRGTVADKVVEKKLHYNVEYERNDDVSAGTPNVIRQTGLDGKKTIRTSYNVDPETGNITANEPVETIENPTPQIEVVGTKSEEIVTEQKFKKTYISDENKEKGLTEVSEPGVNGKTIITRTYNLPENIPVREEQDEINGVKIVFNYEFNTAIPNDSQPSITQPTNEIIKVGTKPKVVYSKQGDNVIKTTTRYTVNPNNGDITEDVTEEVVGRGTVADKVVEKRLHYGVEYERNDDVSAGTPNVIKQSGVDGKKITRTSYTVDPETGNITANEPVETIENPTPQIEVVGTKTEEIVTEQEFKKTYIGDETKEKGLTEVSVPGVNGKTVITRTYNLPENVPVREEQDEINGVKIVFNYEFNTAIPNDSEPSIIQPTNEIVKVGTRPKVVYSKNGDDIVKSTTVYTVDPNNGTISENTTKETFNKDGVKTKVEVTPIPSPNKYVKDDTREKGADNIIEQGTPGSKTVTTTYDVNPEDGSKIENVGNPVIVNPTDTIIKVAAKDKVEIVKEKGQIIERTTNYTVNEKTGEIAETVTDKLISSSTPLIPNINGSDLPDEPELNTNEKVEYKESISTNITTDEKGNEILPPVVDELPEYNGGVNPTDSIVNEKFEYTGTLSTNTPIDENENPILPPVVEELPEYKGGVNPTDSLVNEKPEYKGTLSTNTPVDENEKPIIPLVVEELPEYKGGVNPIDSPVNKKPEYTGTLSTNTPVDENENPILPPVVDELPEYKGGVNPTDSPVNEKPEYAGELSTNTPIDENEKPIIPPVVDELPEYNGDINHTETPVNETSENIVPLNNSTVNNTEKSETTKEETKKERELPDTNSTSVIVGFVSSLIGTLGLGYKSKRRK